VHCLRLLRRHLPLRYLGVAAFLRLFTPSIHHKCPGPQCGSGPFIFISADAGAFSLSRRRTERLPAEGNWFRSPESLLILPWHRKWLVMSRLHLAPSWEFRGLMGHKRLFNAGSTRRAFCFPKPFAHRIHLFDLHRRRVSATTGIFLCSFFCPPANLHTIIRVIAHLKSGFTR